MKTSTNLVDANTNLDDILRALGITDKISSGHNFKMLDYDSNITLRPPRLPQVNSNLLKILFIETNMVTGGIILFNLRTDSQYGKMQRY